MKPMEPDSCWNHSHKSWDENFRKKEGIPGFTYQNGDGGESILYLAENKGTTVANCAVMISNPL